MRQKKLTQQKRIETLERVVAQLYVKIETLHNLIKKLTHEPDKKDS
tara:strand:- start:2784 stop:2921 length:138 start_codon:yes stop_codon:yes gene_type:complete